MTHLQPFILFKNELTRINSLYWSSRYAYSKTKNLLEMLHNNSSNNDIDKLLGDLYGSNITGITRAVSKIKLSEFTKTLDQNEHDLRVASIIHICSAFENSLSGYYMLCELYKPKHMLHHGIKSIIKNNRSIYEETLLKIRKNCSIQLHGEYEKRINYICKKWEMSGYEKIIPDESMARLSSHYKKRHLVAHDQGINDPDFPEKSALAILGNKILITEDEWVTMLQDFLAVLKSLDSLTTKHIVKDSGISVALLHIMQNNNEINLTKIMLMLSNEWKLGNIRKPKIMDVIHKLNLIVINKNDSDCIIKLPLFLTGQST